MQYLSLHVPPLHLSASLLSPSVFPSLLTSCLQPLPAPQYACTHSHTRACSALSLFTDKAPCMSCHYRHFERPRLHGKWKEARCAQSHATNFTMRRMHVIFHSEQGNVCWRISLQNPWLSEHSMVIFLLLPLLDYVLQSRVAVQLWEALRTSHSKSTVPR